MLFVLDKKLPEQKFHLNFGTANAKAIKQYPPNLRAVVCFILLVKLKCIACIVVFPAPFTEHMPNPAIDNYPEPGINSGGPDRPLG